jgi:hypothetical protein
LRHPSDPQFFCNVILIIAGNMTGVNVTGGNTTGTSGSISSLYEGGGTVGESGGGTSVDIESGTGGYRRNSGLPEKVIWFIIDRNLSALGTILAIVGKALSLKGYLIDLNRSRTFKSAGRIFTFNHQCHDKN